MKFNMFSNKKAISPLIATVLLIGFAIALGALIMNWGKGYVENQITATDEQYKSQQLCDTYVDFAIKEIAGRPKLCYTFISATFLNISYTIENKGKQIEGLRIVAIGNDDTVVSTNASNTTESRSIAKGQISKSSIAFTIPATFTSPVQIEFIPIVYTSEASPTLCLKRSLIKTSIPLC
jgi:flagellin-like protein